MNSSKLAYLIHKFVVKVLGFTNYVLSMKLTLTLSLTLLFIPLAIVFVSRDVYPFIAALQIPLLLLPLIIKNTIDNTTISVTRIVHRGVERHGAKARIILRNSSNNIVKISVEERITDKVIIKPSKLEALIGPYEESTVEYNIYAPIGKHILKPSTIVVYDQIGLMGKEIEAEILGDNEVRIKPEIAEAEIPRGSLVVYPVIGEGFRSRLRGVGFDFQGLREYTYGDPVKLIDWKTSAKLQKLYIKEYAIESGILLILGLMVDVEDFQGKPSNYELFARSISTISYYLLLRGASIGLAIVSPGNLITVPPGRGLKYIDSILNAFSEVPWIKDSVDIAGFFSGITKMTLHHTRPRTLLIFGEGSRKYTQVIVENVRKSRLLGLSDIRVAVLNNDKITGMLTRLGFHAGSISSPDDLYELLKLAVIM